MDENSAATASERIDVTVPHSARIWNYWLGGKDNYDVDRVAGDAYAEQFPGIVPLALQSRAFLVRAVTHLAGELGVRQFLDIGTGLPTVENNTHEVAQRAVPAAKVVYVDNDPLVLAHARALLTSAAEQGVTAYIDADLRDPDQVVGQARKILDFTQPVAVMFMGVLGHVQEFAEARSIVRAVMGEVPRGSYLLLWDSTDTSHTGGGFQEAQKAYDDTGAVPYVLRHPDKIEACFDGLELVAPGVVPISTWKPTKGEPALVDGYGGLARKPDHRPR